MDEKNKEYQRLYLWSGIHFHIGMMCFVMAVMFFLPAALWNGDPNIDPEHILISIALTAIMGIVAALIYYKKVKIDRKMWRLFKEY